MSQLQSPADQAARRRRTHKKTRAGCQACKTSHRRCDERQPACTRCLVRGYECIYNRTHLQVSPDLPQDTRGVRLITLLPATPADPFDTMPVAMLHKSHELFYHFAFYRTHIRASIPNNPYSGISSDMANPTWFRTVLLLAAGHGALLRGSYDEMRETYVLHKLEILQVVQRHVYEVTTSDIFRWVVTIISGLVFADHGAREDNEAEAHLHGLFAMLEANERLEGPSIYNSLLKRVTAVGVSLILAARHTIPRRDSLKTETTASVLGEVILRRAWAEISYLYTHLVSEFLRDILLIYTGSDLDAQRVDAPLLKWLLDNLSPQPSASGGLAGDGGRTPHGFSSTEEVWIWTTAVGAYLLTVGSTRCRDELGPGRDRMAAAHVWFEDRIRTWRLEVRQLKTWRWDEVLDKIEWLRTGDGLQFVEEVWVDAVERTAGMRAITLPTR